MFQCIFLDKDPKSQYIIILAIFANSKSNRSGAGSCHSSTKHPADKEKSPRIRFTFLSFRLVPSGDSPGRESFLSSRKNSRRAPLVCTQADSQGRTGMTITGTCVRL